MTIEEREGRVPGWVPDNIEGGVWEGPIEEEPVDDGLPFAPIEEKISGGVMWGPPAGEEGSEQ